MKAKLDNLSAGASSLAGVLALVSASCCALPIGLTMLGLGGSWLSMLGPLAEYRFVILAIAAVVIVLGWIFYLRRRAGPVWLLSFATIAFLAALSAPVWEPAAVGELMMYGRTR